MSRLPRRLGLYNGHAYLISHKLDALLHFETDLNKVKNIIGQGTKTLSIDCEQGYLSHHFKKLCGKKRSLDN